MKHGKALGGAIALALVACKTPNPNPSPTISPTVTGYQIGTADGRPLSVPIGDALPLVVFQSMSDGSTASLSTGAKVSWSGPQTMTATKMSSYRIEMAMPLGSVPTGSLAVFINNPIRAAETPAEPNLDGVLFSVATGSQVVTASVSGVSPAGTASATVQISGLLVGNASNGGTLFQASCGSCHGQSGEGSAMAPGLNAATSSFHAAGIGKWSQPMFEMATIGGIDDGGSALDTPMPVWFNHPANGKRLSAQDVADMWSWLNSQTKPCAAAKCPAGG